MKPILLFLVLVLVLPGCDWFSCCSHCPNGNENLVREEREGLAQFHEVAVNGSGTLHLSQAEIESVAVEASAHALAKVVTEVHEGVLHIYTRGGSCCGGKEVIHYYVAAPAIDAVKLSGGVKLEAPKLEVKSVALEATDSSSVEAHIVAENCVVRGSGSATFKLDGQAEKQYVELIGSGSFDGGTLAGKEGEIAAAGSAHVAMNVTEKLVISAYDESVVEYKGCPSLAIRSSGAAIKNITA